MNPHHAAKLFRKEKCSAQGSEKERLKNAHRLVAVDLLNSSRKLAKHRITRHQWRYDPMYISTSPTWCGPYDWNPTLPNWMAPICTLVRQHISLNMVLLSAIIDEGLVHYLPLRLRRRRRTKHSNCPVCSVKSNFVLGIVLLTLALSVRRYLHRTSWHRSSCYSLWLTQSKGKKSIMSSRRSLWFQTRHRRENYVQTTMNGWAFAWGVNRIMSSYVYHLLVTLFLSKCVWTPTEVRVPGSVWFSFIQ